MLQNDKKDSEVLFEEQVRDNRREGVYAFQPKYKSMADIRARADSDFEADMREMASRYAKMN